jgi:hypothetical protein
MTTLRRDRPRIRVHFLRIRTSRTKPRNPWMGEGDIRPDLGRAHVGVPAFDVARQHLGQSLKRKLQTG